MKKEIFTPVFEGTYDRVLNNLARTNKEFCLDYIKILEKIPKTVKLKSRACEDFSLDNSVYYAELQIKGGEIDLWIKLKETDEDIYIFLKDVSEELCDKSADFEYKDVVYISHSKLDKKTRHIFDLVGNKNDARLIYHKTVTSVETGQHYEDDITLETPVNIDDFIISGTILGNV